MKRNKIRDGFILFACMFFIVISSCKKDDSDSDDCPNCPSVTAISPAQAHAYENLTITGINFSSDPQSTL